MRARLHEKNTDLTRKLEDANASEIREQLKKVEEESKELKSALEKCTQEK